MLSLWYFNAANKNKTIFFLFLGFEDIIFKEKVLG